MKRLLSLVVLVISTQARADSDIAPPKEYTAAVEALEKFIKHELEDKNVPAISIALVDDQKVVYAKGFGLADPKEGRKASAATVYRVGSVSKLFTDLAVMQLVEQSKLDLDAPITKYLPDFKPFNRFDKPITLRLLMTHRSGLVRESPIGHYFDDSSPTLEDSIASLNKTMLVYPPGQKTKYSNAGIAIVGRVLEVTQKEEFAKYLDRMLLQPLGMKHSAFAETEAVRADLAHGLMWTYHGRTFPAPTFALGTAPAGCLYTTVLDLAKFMSALFADGKPIVKKETLDEVYKEQFPDPKADRRFGIGFLIGELEGQRRLGHGGAIYGFSTELAFLPEKKLGVVVVASKDVCNGMTTHIANEALKQMLAVRQVKPVPAITIPEKIKPELVRDLAGRYASDEKGFDLMASAGRLWMLPRRGGFRTELRSLSDNELIVDDGSDYGTHLKLQGEKIKIADVVYERVKQARPEPCPERWRGLIGEYGWDHNTLTILEKDGKLHALIEWFFLYPLTELPTSGKQSVFEFPDFGLYHGEKLLFTLRDGKATEVEAASVVFKRRPIDGEDGKTFRIKPEHPLDELRKTALAAEPPEEKGDFLKPDLADLAKLDETMKLDIRYATTNNFLSTEFYSSARAFMQRPAAESLVRVNKKLKDQGYGLLIHDAYRPWYVTKMFWDATPEKYHNFVADPTKGSRHNRGCAVDLTLYDLKTGKPVSMVGGFDEFSDRSYPDYVGGTSLERWHRDLLRRSMEAEGFAVYQDEWWHFDFKDWKKYPILNLRFEDVK
jgi:CubicO group peptidase (beta-lactamase class C family)/D-alanyl-D-alanine dipeptidase